MPRVMWTLIVRQTLLCLTGVISLACSGSLCIRNIKSLSCAQDGEGGCVTMPDVSSNVNNLGSAGLICSFIFR